MTNVVTICVCVIAPKPKIVIKPSAMMTVRSWVEKRLLEEEGFMLSENQAFYLFLASHKPKKRGAGKFIYAFI